MRVYAFHSTLFMTLLLLTLWSAVPVQATLSWNVQIVDTNAAGIGNGYCPIAVDPNNTPHIAYTRQGYHEETQTFAGHFVQYASWNGSGWSIQQVSLGLSGDACDLKLDANSNPHILYGLGTLTHAGLTGTEWTRQTITSNYVVYASLALDSTGNPHAAYSDGEALKYASWTGSNWEIQTVDASYSEIGLHLSLALDSNDTPYIMYFTPSSYVDSITGSSVRLVSIKLAILKNSSWSIEPVLASYNFFAFGNMVLDSKGYPHFLCTQLRSQGFIILHVSWNGFAWNMQTAVSNADLNMGSAGFLALDSHDNPHIIYITSASELMYAHWTGTGWDLQIVDASGRVRGPCYLAVDSNGTPHISYLANPPEAGLPSPIVYSMYATPKVTGPMQQSSLTSLLLVSAAVIIGAVITVAVYVWKKRA